MRRRNSRLAAVLFAVTLAAIAPTAAFASAPWLADCSGTPSSSQICIYRDWHWEGSVAHMSGDNLSYASETWPSSTNAVEDSVSSTKNLYGSLQVRWYDGRNFTGGYICNTPNTGFYYVGIFSNDAFSSHDVTAGAC
jgi:hypothetical protein